MLSFLMAGLSLGFAAAVQPGQFQAYLVARTMSHGWRHTVPASLAPVLSDVPVVVLVMIALARLPATWLDALRLVGGAFLIVLAARAARPATGDTVLVGRPRTPAHRTVLEAALVNLLNPNPYLAWALVLGPLLLSAWRESPSAAAAFLAGFYGTMVLVTAGTVMALAGARSLGPRVSRVLAVCSAAALAGFGLYQLWAGATGIARRV